MYRSALVYNFEDDNFSWMDASVDKTVELEDVVCMRYQFDPGWQVRWSDLDNNVDEGGFTAGAAGDLAATWADLDNGTDEGGFTAGTAGSMASKWSEFYGSGDEENIYWLARDGVYLSDQAVKTDGIKEYFVERQLIDLNDVVESFTQNRWIYAKQMYFRIKGDVSGTDENPFTVTVGWSDTLMDAPTYLAETEVNLQTVSNSGDVKYDFRSTGRYLAMKYNFNETSKLEMTGAIIDAEQTYGR